jgi:tripartite-type tricarboxylate transporter receptor subunit TctC
LALRRMAETADWKQDLDRNYWTPTFGGSAQLAREMEKEYTYLKGILLDLGLAR